VKGEPSVWAIILTHGGAEEITAACIDSLLAQRYGALTVLLVDNASYDGSGARLRDRYPGIAYLQTGGNFGFTGGNNRGMRYALDHGADYLLILNNDTVVEPTCIATLVASAQGIPRLGAIAPKMLYFDDPTRIWYAGGDIARRQVIGRHRRELEADDPNEAPRLEPMTFATGCCFLMPATTARDVGFFSEDFFIYGEDVELSLRLHDAGYALYYQPAARLYHREPPRRADPTAFQLRLTNRNRRRIARRHYGFTDRVAFALWFYPTRALRLGQYLLRGDWARMRALVASLVEP
jgi:GT2 family glycosyltransferase